jgi:excisionase family DNA binding protein
MPSIPGRSNKLSAYISIADAATYLGLTTRTVRQMIADGRLRGYRSALGRSWWCPHSHHRGRPGGRQTKLPAPERVHLRSRLGSAG